jgi:transcriptional regulator with PAS, ATPase and Fis domain
MEYMPFLQHSLPDESFNVGAALANPGILIVSGDTEFRNALRARLASSRWNIEEALSGTDALMRLASKDFQVLVLEAALPDLTVADFRELVSAEYPHLQIVAVNPRTGQPVASPTAPLGQEIVELIDRQGPMRQAVSTQIIQEGEPADVGLPGIVGRSAEMQKAYALTRMVAPRDTTVLITGESGTGKDLFAQAIHLLSPRHANPFVVINCAAIPEPLLEAELFGYVKGAFTGAIQSRVGRIHAAHKGTLFLDEVGDMPLALQAKMLRFLEQGEVQRLGSTDNFRVDVRVVAATNAHLDDLLRQKLFREDLYYRLSVFPIKLPRLRERVSDIPSLASTFLTKFSPRTTRLSNSAIEFLMQHSWPGNVRELRNVIERASIIVGSGSNITEEHILL